MKKYKIQYAANVMMSCEVEAPNEEIAREIVKRGDYGTTKELDCWNLIIMDVQEKY